MRSNKNLERQAVSAYDVKKIAADFLRWCGEQDALKKRAAEEAITQVDDAMSRALMIWADDGGAAA